MNLSTFVRLAALALFTASTLGCGGSSLATVEGQVIGPDGAPVPGVLVIARSDETGSSRSGETGSDGRYMLGGSHSGGGVPAGNYSVTVLNERKGLQDAPRASAAKVPAKYGSAETSGLRFSVQAGEAKEFDIKLDAS